MFFVLSESLSPHSRLYIQLKSTPSLRLGLHTSAAFAAFKKSFQLPVPCNRLTTKNFHANFEFTYVYFSYKDSSILSFDKFKNKFPFLSANFSSNSAS